MILSRVHNSQCTLASQEHAAPFVPRLQIGFPCTTCRQTPDAAQQHHQQQSVHLLSRRDVVKCKATISALGEASLSPQHGKLAVFVSGGGTNMRALHEACVLGHIDGEIAVVVSDRPDCGAVQFAKENGLPTFIYSPKKASDPAIHDDLLAALQQTHDVNLICLAGFLKLIPPQVVQAFRRRILNIHPALLPAFGGKGLYGQKVHEAVLRSGARFSGCTVHFVDEDYDTGPILAQACLRVPPNASAKQLAALILPEEHRIYSECVAALLEGRVTWNAHGVPVIWTAA